MSHEYHADVSNSSRPRPTSATAERLPTATIKDVARVSGVSVGTVSNVLSNRGPVVRAEKRTRVLAAARSLNFQPSAAARTLVQGRTRTVGVLFHTGTPTIVVDPYASTILQGILIGAARAGYGVLLYPEPWRGQDHDAQLFADRRVDGILAIAPSLKSIPEMLALNLPLAFVSLQYEPGGDGVSDFAAVATDVDNVAGGRIATEHLLSLGHTKIAHLFGDAHQRSAHQREAGWRSALANAGINPPADYCIVCNYHGDAAYAATQRLLALADPPTAIFAANDRLAFECLRAARDSGLSVPHDLSVVGFDDVPSASLVTPALTTIRQPLTQIGSAAVEMLIDRLDKGAAKQAEVPMPADLLLFSPELVTRDSTAPRVHQ